MRPEDVDAGLVETACRARWDAQGSTFTGHYGDVARTWDALAALFPTEAENHRAVERHALAAVLPEIQAQALNDAADEVSGYAWQPGDAPARVMTIEEQRAYMGGANDAHAIVDRLLRDRAVRLTTTTEGPTT